MCVEIAGGVVVAAHFSLPNFMTSRFQYQRTMRVDRVVGGQMKATGCLGVMIVDSGGAQRDQAGAALRAGSEVVAGAP